MHVNSFFIALVATWLQHTVLALPAVDESGIANPSCRKDTCLKEVMSNRGQGSSAADGCTAFFQVTVTPSPSTVHTVTTTTIPKVATVTHTDRQTSATTKSLTRTTVKTVRSTVTVTTTPAMVARRREAGTQSSVGACSVTRQPPKTVPAYASACSNTAQYASACRCIYASTLTTTASACTTTVTNTRKITSTSTSTTSITTETVVTKTSIATNTTTTTRPVTSTQTAQPTCSALARSSNLHITGALIPANSLLVSGTFHGSEFPVLSPNTTASQTPSHFSIDPKGRIFITGTTLYVSKYESTAGQLFVYDINGQLASGFSQPTFDVDNVNGLCRAIQPNGAQKFAYCPEPGLLGVGLILATSLADNDNCEFVQVQAVGL